MQGELPILLLDFPVTAAGAAPAPPGEFWEMSVVPQQLGTGKEQPVFLRFLQKNETGHQSLYFDSFAYIPSWCDSDTLAGCDAPAEYFGAMLDTHFAWAATWAVR